MQFWDACSNPERLTSSKNNRVSGLGFRQNKAGVISRLQTPK